MAQRKRNRGQRVAVGSIRPTSGSNLRGSGLHGSGLHGPGLHRVDTAIPAPTQGSVWGRRRVLLLNSTYEPLTALPIRRAVVMVLCGKADVV
ncbi:MAG: HNH endonuclease, partial [Mycobacterium sp.]